MRHFRLLWRNRWTDFNKTWQEAISQRPLPSLCFSGGSEKQNGRPCLWFAETFSTSPLKPLNRIQQNLTEARSQHPLPGLRFFGLIRKTRWPSWPLIGWDNFLNFFPETRERYSAKLDRKQDLNVLYQVCVFRAEKWIKIATPELSKSFWTCQSFGLTLKILSVRTIKYAAEILIFRQSEWNFVSQILRSDTFRHHCHPGQSIKKGDTLYSGSRYVALWASCWLIICLDI